jgi:hypothetical protein
MKPMASAFGIFSFFQSSCRETEHPVPWTCFVLKYVTAPGRIRK